MFESLDFVYLPSRDAAADVRHFVDGLGGSPVFAIEAFGTRVAMVEMADGGPAVLLAEHLEGDRPILVFRVADLDQAVAAAAERGVETLVRFGIPDGPGAELAMNGPQRIALYQLTRPEVAQRLRGRRDF
ncbi:MAG: hypothetical protein ACJ764_13080 [Solirubrobacteraceae bacterium]